MIWRFLIIFNLILKHIYLDDSMKQTKKKKLIDFIHTHIYIYIWIPRIREGLLELCIIGRCRYLIG